MKPVPSVTMTSIPIYTPSSFTTTTANIMTMIGAVTYTSEDFGGFIMGRKRKKLNWAEWVVYKSLAEDNADHQCYNCYYYKPLFGSCRKHGELIEPLSWCPWWIWMHTAHQPEEEDGWR